MDNLSVMQKVAVYIIPLIFAISLHEAGHAYMARRCGDSTASFMGRVSLNPMKHIDPVGTILFPLIGVIFGGFIFGWAKPVPVDFSRLHNYKRDMCLVALAGPMANLAMALIWALLLKASFYMGGGYFSVPLSLMAQAGISINLSLMLLNLLPILPLDGGRVVYSLLPDKVAFEYAKHEPYGLWILLFLLLIGGLSFIIAPLYMFFIKIILSLIQ